MDDSMSQNAPNPQTQDPQQSALPLRRYLTRLIWLCLVPLMVMACIFAITQVQNLRAVQKHDAEELATRYAQSVESSIQSRISGLKVLATSPLIGDGTHLQDFYRNASGFREGFGSEIILADRQRKMLMNTRAPFGAPLPPLPKIEGVGAVPVALETGKPAVSDLFIGPVAKTMLVTAAVPVERGGHVQFALLTTINQSVFQAGIERESLPRSWRLSLVDSRHRIIARLPVGDDLAGTTTGDNDYDSYAAHPSGTPWSVIVQVPHNITRGPLLWATTLMLAAILAATLIGLFGGLSAGRRISRAVNALPQPESADAAAIDIREIAVAHENLAEARRQRERAQAELRDSEEKFRSAFAHTSIGFVMADIRGAFLEINPAFSNICGYSIEELRSMNISMVMHPDDRADNMRRFRMLLADEISDFVIENRLLQKSGASLWVRKGVSLVRDAQNRPQRVVALVEDISARKRAETALAESNATLAAALASMSDSVFISDANGKCAHINNAFASFHRFANIEDAARLLSEYAEILEVYSVDDQLVTVDNWPVPRALRGESMTNAEYKLRRKDTGESWYGSYNIAPIRSDDGTIVGSVVTGRDVSEQKRTLAELEWHRKHLEDLVAERTRQLTEANHALAQRAAEISDLYDHAPCGYHSLDTRGVVVKVNATELGMLGYARDEFVGHRITDFMTDESRQRFNQSFPVFQQTGKVRDIEFDFVCRDGSVQPFLVSADAIRNDKGVVIASRSTLTDNRERKAREREIASLQNALANRAETAESATRAKSAFLANMSHEIRTPMNGILGMAHLMRRAGIPADQVQRLAKIEAAGNHLLGIINDILDISKIESGKFELEKGEVHVGRILADVASMISERAQEKNLRIVVKNEGLPARLTGDPLRLRQALLNYAGNAIKFTQSGSVTIRAFCLAEDATHATIRFEVTDTGAGIPADVLERLFMPFEQGDATRTRTHGGTGLGLAITKKLAELMNGAVGASSTPGQGSTFWFTADFGKNTGAGAADTEVRQARAAETALAREHSGRLVLVVEDDAVNREVAQLLLEDVRLISDLACDGLEAVEMARGKKYDLILMDMQMPRMDGLEATQRIRELNGYADTPIIAMTANAFNEDKARCLAAGMSDFVSKPADPPLLYAVILKWLTTRKLEC